jgi:hypothetical protein
MKKKVFMILLIGVLIFCSVITYSYFNSNSRLDSDKQDIAKFIFEVDDLNELEIPLIDLYPGAEQELLFSVKNNFEGIINHVSTEYQITIKTYHLVPLTINLYKLNSEGEELILTCDETFSRNDYNELICESPIEEMGYDEEEYNDYKLLITFPVEFNDAIYSNLVDYINLEVKGWQKI